MITVQALIARLLEVHKNFPTAEVRAEGWNDLGDLMDIRLRGDIRLQRDSEGNPLVVIR